MFKRLPAGFLPSEDQGAFFVSMRLPDGASTDRTDAAARKIEEVIGKLPGVDKYFVLGGLDIATGTSNSNVATVIATLKPWDERTIQRDPARCHPGRARSAGSRRFRRPSPSPSACRRSSGLSPTGGFQFMLEDRARRRHRRRWRAAADALTAAARQPAGIRPP